jgi:hypothetical protein
LGLVVFLAVFLPLRLWRAGIENSLWIDETASFVLASQPAAVILDRCAVDTNPPGYFFALKAWLKLGRLFFPQPGILFARALGTVAWLFFAAGVWLLARSLAPGFAALLVTAVTGSAYAAVSANDARGYCFATVGLCLAFLLMVDLYAHPTRPRWAAAVRWLVFALAASVAALSFLPWLLKVLAGIGSLEASAVTWMTPATVPNLVAVFSYWYPFGRIGGPENPWRDAFGAATIILPARERLCVGFSIFWKHPKYRCTTRIPRTLALREFPGKGSTRVCLLLLRHSHSRPRLRCRRTRVRFHERCPDGTKSSLGDSIGRHLLLEPFPHGRVSRS